MTTKNKPNNNLLDSSSYGTLNPISKTTQISKNPRTGMRSSTDTTTPADPLQTARDAERNKFIASATNKEKLRLVNIELYDSIKTYNKSLGQLIIETGLLKKAVTNIFGLDYINYREEIYKMFPNANLQTSGGQYKPGTEIPILSVDDLMQLITYFTGATVTVSGNDNFTLMMNKIIATRKAVEFKIDGIEDIRTTFQSTSSTQILLEKLFSQIGNIISAHAKGGAQWGIVTATGENITFDLIKKVISLRAKNDKQSIFDAITIVLNILSSNPGIIGELPIKLPGQSSNTPTNYIISKLFDSVIGTQETIGNNMSLFWNIRDILIGFLNKTQLGIWSIYNPNRDEIKDPDIKKSGDVADQTYDLIDQLGLTEEQKNTLINIIITLRSKTLSSSSETPEQKIARENKFVNDAQIQFIQLINIITKQNSDPGFMTRAFDAINNNMDLLNDIYDLIITPNPQKIQLIVRNIIDTLGQTLTPYEEKQSDFTTDTTAPELSLGSVVDEDVSQEALKFKDTRPQLKPIPYDAEIFIPFGHITPLPPRIEPEPTVLNTLINKVSSIFKEDIKKKNKKVIVKGKKSKDIEMTAIPTDALSNITDFLKEENKELSVNDIDEVKEIIDENKNNKPLLTKIKKEFNTFKSKVGNFKIGMRYKVDGHLFETIEGAIAYINLREIAGDNIAGDNIPEQRYGLLRYDPPDDEGDDEGDDGGGPPGGGRPGRGFAEPRRRRVVFNGLPKKKWLLLLIVIGLLSSGIITLDQIFKKDVKDDGTPTIPTQQTPTPTDTTGTIVPINPPKKDDTYFQIQKTDFWESVGLSWIIDDYNSLVIRYNSLSPADKKNMDSTITKYYNRFAKLVNIPTLSELKMARQNYEMLMTQYQNAVSNGLDFNTVNNIYLQLQKSIAFLETMTDKYLALENAEGAPNLNKNDADITIDDVDANINQNTYLTTKLDTGKNKAIKDLLSKGMQARIARKLAGKSSLGVVDQELQLYNNYSLVKNDKNDGGLGNIYDNPLIRQNRRYEIKRYLKCNPNPQPFIVPSYRTMYNKSMRDRPILHNVIQIDNTMNYDTGNKLINQKLYSENPPPPQLAKSRLYNPEYHLEKINNEPIVENINNDAIGRSGPYYGLPLSYNQYYQYGNIQQKYNEDFNNYPIQKPIIDIKKSRVLPNSFSLK